MDDRTQPGQLVEVEAVCGLCYSRVPAGGRIDPCASCRSLWRVSEATKGWPAVSRQALTLVMSTIVATMPPEDAEAFCLSLMAAVTRAH